MLRYLARRDKRAGPLHVGWGKVEDVRLKRGNDGRIGNLRLALVLIGGGMLLAGCASAQLPTLGQPVGDTSLAQATPAGAQSPNAGAQASKPERSSPADGVTTAAVDPAKVAAEPERRSDMDGAWRFTDGRAVDCTMTFKSSSAVTGSVSADRKCGRYVGVRSWRFSGNVLELHGNSQWPVARLEIASGLFSGHGKGGERVSMRR